MGRSERWSEEGGVRSRVLGIQDSGDQQTGTSGWAEASEQLCPVLGFLLPILTTVIPAAASKDAPSPPRTRVTALPWVAKATSGGKFIPGSRTRVTREAAGTCDQQPGRQVPGYPTPELGKKPLSDMNH